MLGISTDGTVLEGFGLGEKTDAGRSQALSSGSQKIFRPKGVAVAGILLHDTAPFQKAKGNAQRVTIDAQGMVKDDKPGSPVTMQGGDNGNRTPVVGQTDKQSGS